MGDPAIRDWYARALRAGYESIGGEPISEEHDAESIRSLLVSAERLSDQLEHSILDAPWLRTEIGKIVSGWIESPSDTLALSDLTGQLNEFFGASRSLMIARTETANVMNGAKAAGLRSRGWTQVVWTAASDACPECAAMDGQVLSIGEWEADPTLHPNAVLEGSTFQSLGEHLRMTRATYRGPAVSLRADGELLTIGPNHPMLTTGGLVKAKDLREGDQLIYDLRSEGAMSVREANLYQTPRTEDAFSALAARCRHARIPASRDDFHGDEIADQEVDVVFPDGDLLPILDPAGVEQLRKCELLGADADAEHLSGCRPCRETFERILRPASRGVSRSDVVDAPVLPKSHLALLTVEDTKTIAFDGQAFDASTTSGFYLSNGFVVSNCSCTATPYQGDEEGDVNGESE